METYMRESGPIVKDKDTVNTMIKLNVVIMRVIGKMVKNRVSLIMSIIKIYMKASSITMLNVDLVSNFLKMVISILANIRMENFMVKESIFGKMEPIILGILVEDTSMDVEDGNQADRIAKFI